MFKLTLAALVAIGASTSAFAQSSALDAKAPDVFNPSAIDPVATGNIGTDSEFEFRARLGDGSPVYIKNPARQNSNAAIDYTPSGAIGYGTAYDETRARFGDGSPRQY